MTCVMPWKLIQYNMQLVGTYILILDVMKSTKVQTLGAIPGRFVPVRARANEMRL